MLNNFIHRYFVARFFSRDVNVVRKNITVVVLILELNFYPILLRDV